MVKGLKKMKNKFFGKGKIFSLLEKEKIKFFLHWDRQKKKIILQEPNKLGKQVV